MNNWRYTAENMYKMCFRKKKFRSAKEALKVAELYWQHVYLCPICNHYHLTKRDKPLKGTTYLN